MAVENSSTNPFDRLVEHTHTTPPTFSLDGPGGRDMDAYAYDRIQRLNTLVTTTYDNASSYILSQGVVDAHAHSYDVSFEDMEHYHSEGPAETLSGAGGRDMDVWELDPVDKIQTLITTTYSNASSYVVKTGIVSVPARSYDVEPPDSRKYHKTPDSTSLAGTGGRDLDAWSFGRAQKLDVLARTSLSNSSAYTLPKGVEDSNRRYDNVDVKFHEDPADNPAIISLLLATQGQAITREKTLFDTSQDPEQSRVLMHDESSALIEESKSVGDRVVLFGDGNYGQG